MEARTLLRKEDNSMRYHRQEQETARRKHLPSMVAGRIYIEAGMAGNQVSVVNRSHAERSENVTSSQLKGGQDRCD